MSLPPFRGSQEKNTALMSTYKYGTNALWGLMVPWHQAHECSLALMSAVGTMVPRWWVLTATYKCSWLPMKLMSSDEHAWVWRHDPSWALMSTLEDSWAFISTHDQLWAAKNTHEHGAMAQTALMSANKHAWLWRHGSFSTQTPWLHRYQC